MKAVSGAITVRLQAAAPFAGTENEFVDLPNGDRIIEKVHGGRGRESICGMSLYNIEVAPLLHVTPDLQVMVDSGRSSDNDVAAVFGLRTHMSF